MSKPNKTGIDWNDPEDLKKYYKDYRRKHKEHYKAYDKERSNQPHRIELHNKAVKDYRIKHPERSSSYARVRYKKLKKKACEQCQSKGKLRFHHTDYKNDKGLTLCNDCHIKLHMEE